MLAAILLITIFGQTEQAFNAAFLNDFQFPIGENVTAILEELVRTDASTNAYPIINLQDTANNFTCTNAFTALLNTNAQIIAVENCTDASNTALICSDTSCSNVGQIAWSNYISITTLGSAAAPAEEVDPTLSTAICTEEYCLWFLTNQAFGYTVVNTGKFYDI